MKHKIMVTQITTFISEIEADDIEVAKDLCIKDIEDCHYKYVENETTEIAEVNKEVW